MEIIKVGKVPEQKKYISTCWHCCTTFSFNKSEAEEKDLHLMTCESKTPTYQSIKHLIVNCPVCSSIVLRLI